MEEIIAYLNSKGQASYANRIIAYMEKDKMDEVEFQRMKNFIDFVIRESSKKLPRERILFTIIEEARKQKFMK